MSATLTEQLQFEIREIAAPLVERYEFVKREIEKKETELDELRKARTQLAKVIRNIDPTLIEPPNYGPKRNGKKSPGKGVAPERLQTLTDWLQSHATEVNAMNDGRGFHASGLFRIYGQEIGLPDSTTAVAVKVLHEQGLLRMTGQGNGGSKFFKVIEPAGGS